MQFQVMNSPFSQEQVELLNRLVPTLTQTQQIWLSGYFTATQNSNTTLHTTTEVTTVISTDSPVAISREVTVLFGSQTGNSQGLAKALSIKLEQLGFQVTLSSMSDFKSNTLKKVQNLLIVASTHGEGTPPDNAIPFYEFLHSKRAPQLEDLQFSVLALGDSSYEFYCQTGKDFDKRLEELGGKRLSPRVDCDLDYDDSAAEWIENVLANLNKTLESTGVVQGTTLNGTEIVAEQSAYSRTVPFKAEVLENLNLNGRGSDRETRHLELSLEGSNFQYEPGDCVGIYPENSLALVESLIEKMGWNSEELVSVNKKGEARSLRDALLNNFEITVLTKPLLEQTAKLSSNKALEELVAPGNEVELRNYLDGRDLLDLVQDFSPWKGTVQEFVSILRKMPPRLYSIASSSKARPDEVHLTIRTVQYESHGRERYGVCSTQCAERLEPGEQLSMYIHHNPNFKLPTNSVTPIIMIGPGTGVAPFRAFLEEREESSAEGKAWLFYGDQHLLTDFLYQLDFQRWVKDGVLTRMDVAFSRDTDKKVYVQHRMLEKSRELYQWLEDGASVYICGDEKHMAHDVHNTLITILEQEGGKSTEEAVAYLNDMQQQKRYQRDVY
ncbi:assimilatory sulfite reductase (NADPH) flavoprotein subunit [Paenibacillus macquariensis]|uniref:Sulfite reductase (NADPH) alpha subunit n=1 Tax=Paenibacillus macquariensis TaxID=948756 RepID=A0ABY1JNA8_9BACL|nr:assimilatory sulfite reductase (NADPH) flavoprotein subunit [Paenibacillus macquariensis]MEC0092212.1 assimilatory sulfite reductase (NADPH) flavoprotein subunit [Paenibacillus macquariensis]OAB37240.1 sulfite reductase [NADPH] flavoprotein alpha-component [Paenibacillus macquariensis subsp. macquariensis]SIQ48838.1 sulfite reductase (NADPH) alpha subunit [Paenibacillus macquariensis]